MSARFIFKFQRPIRHLICNRPYKQRRDASTAVEMVRALGGLWHIPALLMVGGSLLAIFITVGDVGTALARSIVSASLLVLTLVVTGLLRRQAERLNKRRHRRRFSQYRKRLERFGFVLAHICAWMVFAELSMQVWGRFAVWFRPAGGGQRPHRASASKSRGNDLTGVVGMDLCRYGHSAGADLVGPLTRAAGESSPCTNHHADDSQRHFRSDSHHRSDRRASQSRG